MVLNIAVGVLINVSVVEKHLILFHSRKKNH
jgi:hypothetical protein